MLLSPPRDVSEAELPAGSAMDIKTRDVDSPVVMPRRVTPANRHLQHLEAGHLGASTPQHVMSRPAVPDLCIASPNLLSLIDTLPMDRLSIMLLYMSYIRFYMFIYIYHISRQSNGAEKTSDPVTGAASVEDLPHSALPGRDDNRAAHSQPIRADDRTVPTAKPTNHHDRNPSRGKDLQRGSTHISALLESIVIVPIGHPHHNISFISFDLPCHIGTQTIHITCHMKAAQITQFPGNIIRIIPVETDHTAQS